ncbi:hypothetical protein WG219_02290 [Ectopseudomonas mendocina]|uniref:Uncharacterized protein n=1 Tax=Ectopseudomonas mendocina TaxID=300 RepID=A0ABZ2RH54_ECTME
MTWRQSTFALPLMISILSAAGLLSALLGEGWWDAVAWLGLGIPAALGVFPLLRR